MDASFDLLSKYRIKPEPKTVPLDFSDAKKLIGAAVKLKVGEDLYFIIVTLTMSYVWLGANRVNYDELSERYTFADGSPISKTIKE